MTTRYHDDAGDVVVDWWEMLLYRSLVAAIESYLVVAPTALALVAVVVVSLLVLSFVPKPKDWDLDCEAIKSLLSLVPIHTS